MFVGMSSILRVGTAVLGALLVSSGLQAGIVWQTTEVEYQAKPGEEVIHAAFPFEIEGDAVTIESIRTSCGCTTTKLEKKTYEPGENGVIEAKFELGSRVGQQQKYISVQTNDPDVPKQDLKLNVYIPHILKIEPRFVYWNKGMKSYHEQSIDLIPDSDVAVSIVNVTSDQKQLQLRWEAQEDENKYRLYLKPVVPEGEVPFFRAIVKIEIDAPVELKQRIFHAYAFMKSS